jgi:hypothetical protein
MDDARKINQYQMRQQTKKQSRREFFIGLGILLILATACNESQSPINYHIGTQGIVLEKLSSNPDKVYETETFALGLMLKNQGAANVDNAILMTNFDDYFLELSPESQMSKTRQVSLKGRSLENPDGEADYLEYVLHAKTLGVIRASVDTKANLNICYNYNTDLTTEVCIDTRTRTADTRTYACQGKEYTNTMGQGAPISITKIESEMMLIGNNVRPVFRIYIKNNGEGYTLNPEFHLCANPAQNAAELNKVKVSAWISKGTELKCDPKIVRLTEKEAIARCYVDQGDLNDFAKETANYLSALRVLLEYDYVDSQSLDLTIDRINEVNIKSPSMCGYYETEIDGKCVTLCDFCVKTPDDPACTRNLNTSNDFAWNTATDFKCACSKTKCLALSKDGKCVFGYCPGDSYCCATDECRDKIDGTICGDHNVCKDNKCTSETLCDYKFSAQNFTCHNKADCNQTTIKTNYCPGDETNVCCKT